MKFLILILAHGMCLHPETLESPIFYGCAFELSSGKADETASSVDTHKNQSKSR